MSHGKAYFNAVADPFTAEPAGLCDEYAGKTGSLRVNQTFLLGTPAGNGYTGASVQSSALNAAHIYALTMDAAGVITANVPTALAGYSDLNTHYTAYRPISMGVKVYYTGAEATTAGTVSVCAIPGAYNFNGFPTNVNDWFNLDECETVAAASMTGPLVAKVHNFDRPTFEELSSISTDRFFPVIGILGTGLPINTPGIIRVETSLIMELIPKHGSVLAQNNTETIPSDVSAMEQVSRRLPSIRLGDAAVAATAARAASSAKRVSSKRSAEITRRRSFGNKPRGAIKMGPMGRRRVKMGVRKRRKRRSLYRKR